LHLFEVGNGFGGFPAEIKRETGELGASVSFGFPDGALQSGNSVLIIALAVVTMPNSRKYFLLPDRI